MEHDRMRRPLVSLGIQPRDYRVLKLLPLIYVAWAGGKMEAVKKDRLRALVSTTYDLSAAGMAILDRWLNEPPTRAYIAEGLRDIYRLALAPDDMEVDFCELPLLLASAEAFAHGTALSPGEPASLTAAEQLALTHIAAELHIERGDSWTKLLQELAPTSRSAPDGTGRSLTHEVVRGAILELLSATELERVNDPDAVRKLSAGEEYLDLELPLAGARRSKEGPAPTGHVLTRSTVNGRTWQSVLALVRPAATR